MTTPTETAAQAAARLRRVASDAAARVLQHLDAARDWRQRCFDTALWHYDEAITCGRLAASYAQRADAIERGEDA